MTPADSCMCHRRAPQQQAAHLSRVSPCNYRTETASQNEATCGRLSMPGGRTRPGRRTDLVPDHRRFGLALVAGACLSCRGQLSSRCWKERATRRPPSQVPEVQAYSKDFPAPKHPGRATGVVEHFLDPRDANESLPVSLAGANAGDDAVLVAAEPQPDNESKPTAAFALP